MWSKNTLSQTKKNRSLIVLSGPSGAGKSTLLEHLLSSSEDQKITTFISYTTRPRRKFEKEGQNYHFITNEEFHYLKKQDFFLEWTHVYNYYYGSPAQKVEELLSQGKVIIKDMDLKGAEFIKAHFPQSLRIFISPPSVEVLMNRIQNRGEESEADMLLRKQLVEEQMKQASEFDHQIINDELSESLKRIKKIIAFSIGPS